MGQQQSSPGQSAAPTWVWCPPTRDCPEGAKLFGLGRICPHVGPAPSGQWALRAVTYPGRCFALPWAKMFKPVGLKTQERNTALNSIHPSPHHPTPGLKVFKGGGKSALVSFKSNETPISHVFSICGERGSCPSGEISSSFGKQPKVSVRPFRKVLEDKSRIYGGLEPPLGFMSLETQANPLPILELGSDNCKASVYAQNSRSAQTFVR